MRKLFFIFLSLICVSVNAQYLENYLVDDVPAFIVKSIVNKNIRDKDAETLRKNNVKEVLIKNEEGKIISKLLVNHFGYIEEYISFNSETQRMEAQWRFGFDDNNNMTAATRREEKAGGRIRVNHIFTYENNLLASVLRDSSGNETQYDFAHSPDGKITKITLLEFTNYTKVYADIFNYDSEGRLIGFSSEEGGEKIYEVSYDYNSVSISSNSLQNLLNDTYTFEGDRITEESYSLYIMPTDVSSPQAEPVSFTEKYSYDEKSLIKDVKLKSSKTSESMETYEYVFYE